MAFTIFGNAYVDLVTNACLEELGNIDMCIEVDLDKFSTLSSGGSIIYEPELKEIFQRNVASGRLNFSVDATADGEFGRTFFITVVTPPHDGSDASRHAVLALEQADATQLMAKSVMPTTPWL